MGYCHIEKLSNLEALPPSGFYVSCFPVRRPTLETKPETPTILTPFRLPADVHLSYGR